MKTLLSLLLVPTLCSAQSFEQRGEALLAQAEEIKAGYERLNATGKRAVAELDTFIEVLDRKFERDMARYDAKRRVEREKTRAFLAEIEQGIRESDEGIRVWAKAKREAGE